jgi:tryptophanyl-tRNA synthetase
VSDILGAYKNGKLMYAETKRPVTARIKIPIAEIRAGKRFIRQSTKFVEKWI